MWRGGVQERESEREGGGGGGGGGSERERRNERSGWATMLDMLISNNKEQRGLRYIFIV